MSRQQSVNISPTMHHELKMLAARAGLRVNAVADLAMGCALKDGSDFRTEIERLCGDHAAAVAARAAGPVLQVMQQPAAPEPEPQAAQVEDADKLDTLTFHRHGKRH